MAVSSVASFQESTTLHPYLKDEVSSLSLPCPACPLSVALTNARDSGLDLTTLVTAYVSRAFLLPYQRKSSPDLLILIFAGPDAQILAGWSSSSAEPPSFQDIPCMQCLRLLYSFDARPTLPLLPFVHPIVSTGASNKVRLSKQRFPWSLILSRVVGVEARIRTLEVFVKDLQDKLAFNTLGTEESKDVV